MPVSAIVTDNATNASLLPGISPWTNASVGTGDRKLESFNFRACLTTADDGIAIQKPSQYRRETYILLERYITALQKGHSRVDLSDIFGCNDYMNHKCDTNDGSPVVCACECAHYLGGRFQKYILLLSFIVHRPF